MPIMKPCAVLFRCTGNYGGPEYFEMVLDMLEDATEGLLETILSKQPITFGNY